jgi:hypothetical protein
VWAFGNNSYWNLAKRATYNSPASDPDSDIFVPIPAITVSVSSPVLLIGASSVSAKPNWYLAGRVSQRLLFSPSSTSDFIAAVQSSGRYKIGLNRLNLILFTDYGVTPYLIEIQIAKWHRQMYLEIWEYSGSMGDIDTAIRQN